MMRATPSDRVRAFGYFIIAAVYFYIAQLVAARAAGGLSSGPWLALVERLVLLFLLVFGYGAMGRAFDRQEHPIRAMGLVARPGWQREFALGAALGWGMLIASILPLVLTGGLIVSFWTDPRQFGAFVIDLLVLAVAALAEEVAFRGYPFQRLIEAIGPVLATLLLSSLFGLAHIFNPGANRDSTLITVFSGCLLSIAYLRTRALWVSWGWHFAWNAVMGLLFGLPISGLTRFSPVIQSNTVGPISITGGDYGPEASVVTAIVLLVGLVIMVRVTRGYAHLYAQPVIVAAGMPVDLDAMSAAVAPHHSPGAVPPAGTTLVQIVPLAGAGDTSGREPSPPVSPLTPASRPIESRDIAPKEIESRDIAARDMEDRDIKDRSPVLSEPAVWPKPVASEAVSDERQPPGLPDPPSPLRED